MRRFVATVLSSLLVLAVACNESTPPPAAPTTTTVVAPPPAASAASAVGDAGPATSVAASDPPAATATAGDAGADYYACGTDSDCVAVPVAQCCPNGRLEAVNNQSADAYAHSVTCEKKRMCPMYRVLDRRVAICGNKSHKCEMVIPSELACTGSGPDVRKTCPSGSACDSGGHCAPTH